AQQAVAALAKLTRHHRTILDEVSQADKRRLASEAEVKRQVGIREKLKELHSTFCSLVKSPEPQRRGYLLEQVLRELFALYDLDPKASFRIEGEQIDGAFSFENTDYLLEAKWQKELVGIQELDAFSAKVGRKLDNTLGLFIAINGFSADAVKHHCTGRRMTILMDGADLAVVLEAQLDFVNVLRRKRR